MTKTIRRLGVTLSATAAVLGTLSMGSPALALTPDPKPIHLESTGESTTTSSRAYEEAVADCMTARGFDYDPWIYSVESTVLEADGQETDITLERFVGDENPNDEIVRGLSVTQRIAYFHALQGDESPLDASGYPTGHSVTISDGSCGDTAATP